MLYINLLIHENLLCHVCDCGALWWQVLKYSQTDVDRMRKEWKLEFQGRLLAKENEWLKRLEAKDKEKASLNDMINKMKQSNAQMK